jgi:hypothetical protein
VGVETLSPAEQPDRGPDRLKAQQWSRALLWGIVLIVVLVFSALAIVRFSRRFRSALFSDKRSPTADVDVWKMHRLAEDALEDQADDGPDSVPPRK